MFGLTGLETAYVVVSVVFHAVLIGHFAVRLWRFDAAVRYGWVVYALSVPFAALSIVSLAAGSPWWLWLGGIMYFAWACFGYWVEYVARIEWRIPIRWRILAPYLLLYLATAMLYWWPVGRLNAPAWYLLGAMFLVSSSLNGASHHRRSALAPAG